MRHLKTGDIPKFAGCITALGVKDEVASIARDIEEGKKKIDQFSAGFELIWALFERASENNTARKIYEFLAGPFEMTPEEVEDLDLQDFGALCKQLAEENNLGDFFKAAASAMK